MLIYQTRRGKQIDLKGEDCIMVGHTHNRYILWNPKSKKILTTRDVVFDEKNTIQNLKNLDKLDSAAFIEIENEFEDHKESGGI